MIRKLIVAAVCVAVWSLVTDQGLAQRNGQEYLFAQYYTPGGASTANAEMYPAPHPVPAHVGNSYYTYQPLMPHEMMYTHSRNYYSYYATPGSFYCDMCGGHHNRPGYGFNKTTVRWQGGSNAVAPIPGTLFPFTKVQSLLHKHHHAGPEPGNCLYARVKGHLAAHCAKCAGRCGSGGCPGCGSGACDCGDSGWSDEGCDGGCDGGCDDGTGWGSNWIQSCKAAIHRAANLTHNRYPQ